MVIDELLNITEMSDKECEEFDADYKPVSRSMDILRNRVFTTQAIWKGSDFTPLEGKPIVYCTANYKAGTFKAINKKDWQQKVDKYNIVCWCYQDELLPF